MVVAIVTLFAAAVCPWPYCSGSLFQFHFVLGGGQPQPYATPQQFEGIMVRWKDRAFTDEFLQRLGSDFRLYSELEPAKRLRAIQEDLIFTLRPMAGTGPDRLCCWTVGFSYPDAERAHAAAKALSRRFIDVSSDDVVGMFPRAPCPVIEGAAVDCESSGLDIVDVTSSPRLCHYKRSLIATAGITVLLAGLVIAKGAINWQMRKGR